MLNKQQPRNDFEVENTATVVLNTLYKRLFIAPIKYQHLKELVHTNVKQAIKEIAQELLNITKINIRETERK